MVPRAYRTARRGCCTTGSRGQGMSFRQTQAAGCCTHESASRCRAGCTATMATTRHQSAPGCECEMLSWSTGPPTVNEYANHRYRMWVLYLRRRQCDRRSWRHRAREPIALHRQEPCPLVGQCGAANGRRVTVAVLRSKDRLHQGQVLAKQSQGNTFGHV
jgi:hypothetical protein